MLGSSLVVVVALCCAGGGDSVPGAAKHRDVFPRGVAVEIGLGRTSHRDEFISPERYSGSLPYVGARWSRWHGDHGYEVHLAFRGSGDVSNYTVSSDVVHFGLGQGFLYPAGTVRLLGKDAYLFLGPATDLHVFTNEQRIAVR